MAEQAIQTFTNHLVAILTEVNDWFPLYLWCYLVQRAKLIVNLLHQSNVAPKILAYAHVHGQHGYMKHPFAPLDVQWWHTSNPKTDVPGMYTVRLVTASALWCSIIGVSTSTLSKRERQGSAMQFFKHQYITNLQIKPETLFIKAAAELISVLKGTVLRAEPWTRGNMGPPARDQIISCKMTTKSSSTGTIHGLGWRASCKRQWWHASTSPNQHSNYWHKRWRVENSRWFGYVKWWTLCSENRANS